MPSLVYKKLPLLFPVINKYYNVVSHFIVINRVYRQHIIGYNGPTGLSVSDFHYMIHGAVYIKGKNYEWLIV